MLMSAHEGGAQVGGIHRDVAVVHDADARLAPGGRQPAGVSLRGGAHRRGGVAPAAERQTHGGEVGAQKSAGRACLPPETPELVAVHGGPRHQRRATRCAAMASSSSAMPSPGAWGTSTVDTPSRSSARSPLPMSREYPPGLHGRSASQWVALASATLRWKCAARPSELSPMLPIMMLMPAASAMALTLSAFRMPPVFMSLTTRMSQAPALAAHF